jgi:excisionase family DNA binding protein
VTTPTEPTGRPVNTVPLTRSAEKSEPDLILYRPSDAARILSLSRSVVFDLLRTGRLRSVKEGRTRLIPASAVREYVALLEREAA